LDELVSALVRWGPWGLLLAFVAWVLTNVEKAEKVGGHLLGFVGFLGTAARQQAIKNKIQGHVNGFARALNGETTGSMPLNMSLRFVKEIDRAELLKEGAVVVVRIKDRRDDDRNLVHAMLAFCPVGLLSQARPYFGREVGLALDLTVTRKLLNSLKHYSALKYLYDEIVAPAAASSPSVDVLCRIFDELDERGWFSKMLLKELVNYGASVESRYPDRTHAIEVRGLIDYIHLVATRGPGETLTIPGFQSPHISTAIVLIGITERMEVEGTAPYLHHLQFLIAERYETAYLVARDRSIPMAEDVARLAEKQGLGNAGKAKEYTARDASGRARKQVLIEFTLGRPGHPTQPIQPQLFEADPPK